MTPIRTIKLYYLKFARLKGDPQSLARGTAIGTFTGLMPIIPLHTILVIAITFITRTSTIAALFASLVVCNPLTYVPQYYFSIVIGNAVTPYHFSWSRMKEVLDFMLSKPGFELSLHTLMSIGFEATVVLLAGGALLALPFTVASYFISLNFFIKLRERKCKKHLLNHRK